LFLRLNLFRWRWDALCAGQQRHFSHEICFYIGCIRTAFIRDGFNAPIAIGIFTL
jgi:hypothetical protein